MPMDMPQDNRTGLPDKSPSLAVRNPIESQVPPEPPTYRLLPHQACNPSTVDERETNEIPLILSTPRSGRALCRLIRVERRHWTPRCVLNTVQVQGGYGFAYAA